MECRFVWLTLLEGQLLACYLLHKIVYFKSIIITVLLGLCISEEAPRVFGMSREVLVWWSFWRTEDLFDGSSTSSVLTGASAGSKTEFKGLIEENVFPQEYQVPWVISKNIPPKNSIKERRQFPPFPDILSWLIQISFSNQIRFLFVTLHLFICKIYLTYFRTRKPKYTSIMGGTLRRTGAASRLQWQPGK